MEQRMNKFCILALLWVLAGTAAHAQSTVVTFDNPPCSGNGVGTYGGINFSVSAWDCENPGLAGQTGTSISWYHNNTSGQFKFVAPEILHSLSAATSTGTGMLTISTDAGESVSRSLTTTFQTVTTGFTKAATTVTVTFTGGWTIELDNIAYQSPVVTAPLGTLNLFATLTWDDGTPVVGSVSLLQIINSTGHSLGTFPINSTGVGAGTIKIDMSQPDPLTFQVNLMGANGAQIGLPATFQVLKVMFPAASTGLNAKLVLAKSTTTIKSFDIGLVP
jgi:hypothetical protein